MDGNHRIVECFCCPIDTWPKYFKDKIASSNYLNRSERMQTVCFFYGNGITDLETIIRMIRHKLRDRSAFAHVKSIVQDLQTTNYDDKWTYYNTNEKCMLYMNGSIAVDAQAKLNVFDLKMNIWNRYCSKHKTSLSTQIKFFGEDTEICDKIYACIGKL